MCAAVATLAFTVEVVCPLLLLDVVETSAVLLIVLLPGALGTTWSTITKVAEDPADRVAIVAVVVPVPPTAGFVTVNAGPAVWLSETKVALAGTASVTLTF
jgi:hypothetical protein